MLKETVQHRTLQLLADMLEYPQSNPAEKARECADLVAASSPDAASRLRQFQALAQRTPSGRLEEIYTITFDLEAACHPYVGYHLFGESYKRSTFLLELKERFRGCGFKFSDSELPDRVSVLLRFVSVTGDEEERQEIINEGLLPALNKMVKEAEEGDEEPHHDGDAYRNVLQALRMVLQDMSTRREESTA